MSATETSTDRSPLHQFLSPDAIVIVGASADPTKRGYKAMVGPDQGRLQGQDLPHQPPRPT